MENIRIQNNKVLIKSCIFYNFIFVIFKSLILERIFNMTASKRSFNIGRSYSRRNIFSDCRNNKNTTFNIIIQSQQLAKSRIRLNNIIKLQLFTTVITINSSMNIIFVFIQVINNSVSGLILTSITMLAKKYTFAKIHTNLI